MEIAKDKSTTDVKQKNRKQSVSFKSSFFSCGHRII